MDGENARTGIPVRDHGPTLAAAGILAYVTEAIGHELLGHGSICLANGGAITALAPLWMRCSVETRAMVLAGPVFNFASAAVIAAILLNLRASAFSYLLWLAFCFNLLVACGYLAVGGGAGFGDWNYVLAEVRPAWAWRIGAVILGLAGYGLALRAASSLYARIAGSEKSDRALFLRRTFVPTTAAGVVAIAAETFGGRWQPSALILPSACTLFVGFSVGRTDPSTFPTIAAKSFVIRANRIWQVCAFLIAFVYVFTIGPAPGS